ncbi:hypothetical protein MVES1_002651 [Malassezia vespertilionis]|nr:uncharacterized protein MVES1_002651 [Malassezia vespertilionis]WFD07290.1 hypothetical protein MVES1_002651 [Malassezia vespertilionis]
MVPVTPAQKKSSIHSVYEVPGSRLPVRTPQSKPHAPQRTPRPSVLGESMRENMYSLARDRSVDEVAKTAEAHMEALRREKHALLNEREDLRTELQLGRQRELKLRGSLEKQEKRIQRYKERATHFTQSQMHVDEQLAVAQEQVAEYAEINAQLSAKLDTLQSAQDEQCIDNEVTPYIYSLTRTAARLLASAQEAKTSATTQLVIPATPPRDDTAAVEHIQTLQEQRNVLMDALCGAEEQNSVLQRTCDALRDQGELHAWCDTVDTEHTATLAFDNACMHADLHYLETKLEMEKDRSAWLESQLDHTRTIHSKVLASLAASHRRDKESANTTRDCTLQAELNETRASEASLRAKMAQLMDDLERLSFYEEAYAAQSRQSNLLAELAALAQETCSTGRGSRELELLDARLDASRAATDALTRHRDRLHGFGTYLAKEGHAEGVYTRRNSG